MAKIEAGCVLGEYTVDTAFESGVKLSDLLKRADKTVLLFLRYYGCRICQLEMRDYTAIYDAAGLITGYEKISYPNCQGTPVALSSEDGAFRAPEYVINSSPNSGEAPYVISYVDTLPTIGG